MREVVGKEQILQLISHKRNKMPRIGGRKLYRLLYQDLQQLDHPVGRDKFFDILRQNNLLVKRKKRYEKTTNSYHRFNKHNNKISKTILTGPNQAFVSDITYIRTGLKFAYLFLITDAYSRKIVGWYLSHSMGIEGAIKALKMATRQSKGKCGIIHHSDRGIQYCCNEYVRRMKKYKMEISMTEQNHCYENAIAERVNGILKDEFLLGETWNNFEHARQAVAEAVDTYNNLRPHMSLKFCTPNEKHQAA